MITMIPSILEFTSISRSSEILACSSCGRKLTPSLYETRNTNITPEDLAGDNGSDVGIDNVSYKMCDINESLTVEVFF